MKEEKQGQEAGEEEEQEGREDQEEQGLYSYRSSTASCAMRKRSGGWGK